MPTASNLGYTMSHGSGNNNNNNTSNNNNNHQQRSNGYYRPRNSRSHHRFLARSAGNAASNGLSLKVQCDKNSTSLVNGIKQGMLAVSKSNSMSPVETPINAHNCSPVHQRSNFVLHDSAALLWEMDFSNWTSGNLPPYPKCIPTLNGSPYTGGPSTATPSPVGSSRGSPYSNSSPPQAVSGGSSPMMGSEFPSSMNGDRRSSAEEMVCKVGSSSSDELMINLHDNACASSSQSPEQPTRLFNPIVRKVSRKSSDKVNHAFSPPCRSSESRSSNESTENVMGDYRIHTPDSTDGTQPMAAPSGSTRCNDCTPERACDNCSEIYHNNMMATIVNKAESAQETLPLKELSPAITGLQLVPFNPTQQIPITNQLTFPTGNQMVLPTCNPNMTEQLSVTNTFPISGQQLTVPVPSDDQPLASSSPLMFLNQRIVCEQPILYCSEHNGAQRFYCQTCSKLFCNECGPEHHVGHITVHLLDATESAQKQAGHVLAECRYSIATIRDELDKGVIAAQTVDAKAREAIAAVRNLTRQLTESLRIREKELVKSIEAARQSKQSALQIRDEGLKFGLTRLSQTIDKLNRSVEASSLTSSPLDLFVAKDMASAQVFHVKSIRNNLPPPEEHFIRFQVMDSHIIELVRNLGNVLTGNGHIGDRRLLARPTISLGLPMPISRARAIPGANYKVSITTKRRIINGNPYLDIGQCIMSLGDELSLEENLCRPWGVACDREGHIVIADRSNNRIQIFRTNGSFVRRFGSHGIGCGQFDRPAGVAVDARRRIVVADKDNHRIQVLTMEGEFLLCFGEKGTTPGLFNYPWDVATNDACQIVVSDTRNHRIQLFSPEGIFLRKFGFETQPQLWKCLDSPRGVAFNNEGNVIVTDFNNHRIIVVDSDFMGAKLLGCDSLSPHPMPPKTFLRPQGVAVDDNGHIIVCDSRNHRVQILDANGVCRCRFGTQGSGPDEMDRPSGVAVTPDGKIVVVDFGNNRVLMF